MANMIGSGVQFEEFKKVVKDVFNAFHQEEPDKDDMFLATLLGSILVLQRQNLLLELNDGKIDFVKQLDAIKGKIQRYEEEERKPDNYNFYLYKVIYDVIDEYWTVACKVDHDATSQFCRNHDWNGRIPYEKILEMDMPLGNLKSISNFLNNLTSLSHGDSLLSIYSFILGLVSPKDSTITKDSITHPLELMTEMFQLLDFKDCEIICNPYAGAAYYCEILPKHTKYIGYESKVELWKLGMLRLALTDLKDVEFYNKEYKGFFQPTTWDDDFEMNVHFLSTPPTFYNKNIERIEYHTRKVSDHEYVEDAEENIYSSMLEDCNLRSCFLVPASILYNRTKKWCDFRETYLCGGDVNTVILLPSGITSSANNQMAIIVSTSTEEFENGTEPRFVDSSDCVIVDSDNVPHLDFLRIKQILQRNDEKHVLFPSLENLEMREYSWDPREYIGERISPVVDKDVNYLQLGQLIMSVYAFDADHNMGKGRVIRITDLSKSPFEVLNIDSLPLEKNLDGTRRVDEPVVVVSTIHSLMPTIVKATKECPVYLDKNIVAFVIDESKVDSMYLAYQLSLVNSEYYYRGLTIPKLSLDDIYKIKLNVCSLDTQKERVSDLWRQYAEAKVREAGLSELMAKMKAEYVNEVRMRKHDMKPYIEDLLNSHELIKYYVCESVKDSTAKREIGMLLDGMYRSITCLSDSLNNLSREEKFGEPENTDIDSFLRDLVSHHSSADSYTMLYNIDAQALSKNDDGSISSPIVCINKDDFRNACDNIISNALHHGFIDRSRKDYGIQINFSADYNTGMYIIDFCNNGKDFPKGLTKERYGMLGEKAGTTGRTGIGGYRVKSVVLHFKGDYDVIHVPDSLHPNVIRIYLPIIYR